MARRLGGENSLILQDNLSDTKIKLLYRMPTTEEVVSYRNGGTKRVRNKIVSCVGENRLRHGKKILTGIGKGSFEKKVADKWVPVSCDAKSKNYDKAWKKLVFDQAPDLVETLAVHVFDASVQPAEKDEDGEEDSLG